MAQISKRKVNTEVLKRLYDLFFEIIGKQNSKNDFLTIVNELLSYSEQIVIAKRIAVLFLLLQEVPQEEIRKTIKVSGSTICKYALMLKTSILLTSLLRKKITQKNMGIFFKELFSILYAPGTPHTNWTNAWQLKRQIEIEKRRGI